MEIFKRGNMSKVDINCCAVVILAAGKGSRMQTEKPKVIQSLLGEPMLLYVLSAVSFFEPKNVWVVVGEESSAIREVCKNFNVQFVVQEKQLGTGNAVLSALPQLKNAGVKHILIVNGDCPLVTAQFFTDFLKEAEHSDISFAVQKKSILGDYGRVLRKNGAVVAIVEAKDFDPAVHGGLDEINLGIYSMSLDLALSLLPKLSDNNASHEYYITDVIQIALDNGYVVKGSMIDSEYNLIGVNTAQELIEAEEVLRKERIRHFLTNGVIIHLPESVTIGPFVTINPGVELYGPCEIYGNTYIDSGVVIHSHCWIKDTQIFYGACIHAFSHLEKACIGKQCLVGPYARLRPQTIIDEQAHIGNFVEVKNTQVGVGVKANHLTYLGDAHIGPFTNIGAGTITCNYDGETKHQTVIGEQAFIGSNTAIVAPVSIGDNACVGAGSVITKDVPEKTLAIARGRQHTYAKYQREIMQPIEK